MRRLKMPPKGRKKKRIMEVKLGNRKLYWDYDEWLAYQNWYNQHPLNGGKGFENSTQAATNVLFGDGVMAQVRAMEEKGADFTYKPLTTGKLKDIIKDMFANMTPERYNECDIVVWRTTENGLEPITYKEFYADDTN